MATALIGYTGFVGSNLLRQRRFDDCFDSSNIDQIRGRGFDLIVVAAGFVDRPNPSGNPERDLDEIESLIRALSGADARRVVLISTVDVFLDPAGVDEDSPTPMIGLRPYGRHRRRLEELVSARFDATVVRLPHAYGAGPGRSVIDDFLSKRDVSGIDSRALFQFYDLERLWSDIRIAIDNELPLVHLVAEPVSVGELARTAFGIDFHNELSDPPPRYDVRTRYADLLGGQGTYIEDKARELAGISAFVASTRRNT